MYDEYAAPPSRPVRVLRGAWAVAAGLAYFCAFAPPYLAGAAWQVVRDGWRLGRADAIREDA